MRVTGVYFSPTGGTKRALETLCGLLGPAELLELGAGRYYQQPEEHLERGLRVLETAFGQKLAPRPSVKA